MATIRASENEYPSVLFVEGAAPSTPASGLIIAYAKAGGVWAWKDDTGVEHLVAEGDIAAHLADPSDAHDASAISIVDAGALYTATDVEAALAEVMGAVSGGGIPSTIVDAKGDIIAASAADTPARLAVGTNGQVLKAASGQTTGLEWGPAALTSTRAVRTSSDITVNGTGWANLDTGLDLTIAASSGDVLLVHASGVWGAELVAGYLDAATIVSASPVNYISGGAGGASSQGVTGWRGDDVTNVNTAIGASIQYVVQSGDISGGNVVLRLRVRTATATNKVLFASSNVPFHWGVVNLRQ